MKTFLIHSRFLAAPPSPSWQEELAKTLGEKPRRISTWMQLGLYGALSCMGKQQLPQNAVLILLSKRGPFAATYKAFEQIQEGWPMPMTFLQTQPSQLLAEISARLHWSGSASFLGDSDVVCALKLASAQAEGADVLLGRVDEIGDGSSQWLYLTSRDIQENTERDFSPASAEEIYAPKAKFLRLGSTGLQICYDD